MVKSNSSYDSTLAAAMYLALRKQIHWIATVPATFMTAVSITYILAAPEGLKLSYSIAYPIGLAVAIGSLAVFLIAVNKKMKAQKTEV